MDRAFLQDRRVWIGGGVIVALIIAAASWFMLISPKLDSTDSLHQQNDDAQTANMLVQVKNAKLAKESQNLDGLKATLAQAVAGLPADSGLSAFTREVTAAASARHITLTTIAITAPTAQTPATTTAPDASTSGDSGSTSTTTTTAPTTSATTAATPDASTVSIQATLTTSGPLPAQTAFLSDLQNGARRVLVNSSQVSVASGSRVNSVDTATTMTTELTIYTSPATASQLTGLKAALSAK